MQNELNKGHYNQKKSVECFSLILTMIVLTLFFCSKAISAETPLVERLKDHQASLRGENLPIPTIMKAISRQTGINIFVANNIEDTISIEMEDLTLYDIFHLIIDTKNLHYWEKNNIILVEKEEDFKGDLKDLLTENLCTTYTDASDHLSQLEMLLSPNGTMSASSRGDCLLVRDREEHITNIKNMLEELDRPIPQVHIEAHIVTIGKEGIRNLGIKWNYDNLSTRNPIKADADLSVSNTSTLAVGFLRDNLQLDFELQALQQENKLRILSAPRILVLDGKEAEIKQGQEVPFVTQTADTINTSFREANLSLKVTPKILRDNYIVLDVTVTNDSVDQTSSSTEPLIDKQEIATNLFLENKLTVVIGGILLQSEGKRNGGIPGLSKIPLLGHLFSNTENADEEKELLVFITPTIVNMPSLVKASETELAKRKIFENNTASNGDAPQNNN